MKARSRQTLNAVGWLAGQPASLRKPWLDACIHRRVRAGELLYSSGDPAGGVYGLAAGFIDVFLTATARPPQLIYIAGRGWWVGESAAITGSPRRVELRARTGIDILYLEARRLKQLSQADPRYLDALGQLTVSHLDNALTLAATLMEGDTRVKILMTLVRLAGGVGSSDDVTSLPCSQHELGEMVGLSRNSIGPVLRALEAEGLICREVYGEIAYNPIRLQAALDALSSSATGVSDPPA